MLGASRRFRARFEGQGRGAHRSVGPDQRQRRLGQPVRARRTPPPRLRALCGARPGPEEDATADLLTVSGRRIGSQIEYRWGSRDSRREVGADAVAGRLRHRDSHRQQSMILAAMGLHLSVVPGGEPAAWKVATRGAFAPRRRPSLRPGCGLVPMDKVEVLSGEDTVHLLDP